MRSVHVVFPASMCAIIPMLRICSSCVCRAISISCAWAAGLMPRVALLPPVMREGLVGLGHAVDVFLFLDGAAAVVGRVEQLFGQFRFHGLAGARPGVIDEPAN